MSRKKPVSLLKKLALFASLLLLACGVVWFHVDSGGNFRTVVAGRVYRSGQLDEGKLAGYAQKYGIKSVLNLRGRNEGTAWWDEEVAACARLGIKHYDLALSSKYKPSQEQMQQLLDVLKDAPRPILIHCARGADRASLVSAIYLHEFEGVPCKDARRQLSLFYGHIQSYRPKMIEAFNEFCGD